MRVSMCHCLACQRPSRQPLRDPGALAGRVSAVRRGVTGTSGCRTKAMRRRHSLLPDCGATVYYFTDPAFAIPVGVLADPDSSATVSVSIAAPLLGDGARQHDRH